MTTLKKISIAFIVITNCSLLLSCRKQGCTDENAFNYSTEAKKDDGSCTYPTSVTITTARLTYFPNVDSFGDFWDNTSTADPYILIEDDSLELILKTSAAIDDQSTIEWPLNPSITIVEEDFDTDLTVYVYDDDGSTDEVMGETVINLDDYTVNGSETDKYPTNLEIYVQNCVVEFDLIWN